MFDSMGVLSMLDRFRRPSQARWVPILDTASLKKEGRIERYWPVGVTASHMACAILKVSFPVLLCQDPMYISGGTRSDISGSREAAVVPSAAPAGRAAARPIA